MLNGPENLGGLGGPLSIQEGTRDTRLIERAIRERWPIEERFRKPLIDRQIRIAIDPQASPRESTLAFKAILAAEAQNQADEHHAEGETVNHQHSGTVSLEAVRRELLNDEDYLEYQRRSTLDADSSPVGANGEPGQVENGKAPGLPRPGANGSSNGEH